MASWLALWVFLGMLAAAPAGASADASEDVDASWLARAQQGLAEKEYRASHNGKGLQAPNRRHNLRTYFEANGIRVHDRTADGSPELLRLKLSGIGRGDALAPVETGEVVSEGGRVEIRRPGLVEWYVNSSSGLEQGFTLDERPEGEGPLRLALAVSGSEARLAGEAVRLRTATGRRLAYDHLVVIDAKGRTIPARLAVPAPDVVQIEVEDEGATYPLTIDPLLSETDDGQLESDQADARLGWSVAGAGDVNGDGYADVIVGAFLYDAGESDEGAAFVFLGSAVGIGDAGAGSADFQLESDQASGRLGQSVAGAGDVNGDGYDDVIVGAPKYDAGETDEGAAFVFLGSAGGIVGTNPGTAHAQLESDQAFAEMGFSVAGAGDVNGDGYQDVVAGAHEYDAGQSDEGAAFVFLGSVGGIVGNDPGTAHAQLESDQSPAGMGFSVAGAGDVNGDGYADVIVGAHVFDAPSNAEGAAFVFLGSAGGVVGTNPGTAHAQLETDQIGAQVNSAAGAGDVNGDGYADVILGSMFYDAGASDEGAAFLFLGSAGGIVGTNPGTAHAQLESDQAGAQLGLSVAGAGDVNGDGYADVIVNAWSYDAGQTDEGAAFVFLGSSTGIPSGNPTTAYAQIETNQVDGELRRVAGAGDVNGDGYADVIVGADFYDAGESNEGAAFIYHGGSEGILDGDPTTAAAQLESDQAHAHLGWSVAGAGDVNGDGYADVIVGADDYDAGETDEGAAFVFLGSAGGIVGNDPGTAHAQLESDQASARLGDSVAGAGDVNGDGYADVIVGASLYDAGSTDEGAAFVFLGSAGGIAGNDPGAAHAQLESDQASARLGDSVAGAGDVNGDGYADVIVGANLYDAGTTDEGAAWVFHGSASGIASGGPGAADAQLEMNLQDAGVSDVAGAGDVNGDGYADVIVGSRCFPLIIPGCDGAAFVFHGSASGTPSGNPRSADALFDAQHWIVGTNPGTAHAQVGSDGLFTFFGESVAGAGDVNGDGYADVIVGAWDDNGGAAFVFHSSASGIVGSNPATAAAWIESDQVDARMGLSVAGAGDVDGDGFGDVIVGADEYDAGETNEGAAFVYYGGGGTTGRSVLAQQLRGGGDTTSVEPWGVSHDADDFQVRMTATHPEGRGRVKLEVEACETGVAFGDVSCISHVSSTWTEYAPTVFLAGSQVESGGDTTDNPDVTGGAGGTLIPYTETGSFTSGATFEGDNLDDGDIGVGNPSDGTYAIPDDGFLELDFGSAKTVGSIAVYNGYTNRDDGVYTLLDDASNAITGWSIATPSGSSNDTADSFWLVFDPPVTTSSLTLAFTTTDCCGTASFREIQVMEPTGPAPPPVAPASSSWTAGPQSGVELTETVPGLSDQTLYRWRARVLHAPFSVTEAGITAPPNPAHGPWRRLQGQVREADIATGADGDGDSVLDAVEDAGPNNGDANGDGTADSLQADVASLPEAGGASYIALEVSGGCSTVHDVMVLAENELPALDPTYDYPHGLVEFEAPCETATIDLWFHGATSLSAPYRKYGPTTPGVPATTTWYTLPGAVFGTDVIDGNTVATVTLSLADNALGDDTGDDGTILDAGGPIAVPEPDAMLGLGACLAGLFLLNRRRKLREA
jgi:hypothetical protein